MVAQRMGSQGFSSNSNGETRIQTQDPKPNPLASQGSFYSLTIDEVQNQLGDLGKPFCSMNLDELLKTMFTVESNNEPTEDLDCGPVSQKPGSSLNRQSSLTLIKDLSKKTVDEVWQNIQEEQNRSNWNCLDRKATLGEMTLEDFLVKAGIVAESSQGTKNMGLAPWMNNQTPNIHSKQQQNMVPAFISSQPLQQNVPIGGNGILDGGYPEAQLTMCSSPVMGTLSDTHTHANGRKRVAPDDIVEKSVARRQKRMIKNRESAARSRARKQAYTHELENKVNRLEEENVKLMKQKKWENMLPNIPPPQAKYQLRRTSSAPM